MNGKQEGGITKKATAYPTCYDALQGFLTTHPDMWRHDLNIRWSNIHQGWEISVHTLSKSPISSGTSGKHGENDDD